MNLNDLKNSSSFGVKTIVPIVGIGTSTPNAPLTIRDPLTAAAYTGAQPSQFGVNDTITQSGTLATELIVTRIDPSSNITGLQYGLMSNVSTASGLTHNVSSPVAGGFYNYHQGSGTVSAQYGIYSSSTNSSTGTISGNYGAAIAVNNSSSGTVTNQHGAYVIAANSTGSVGTAYGVRSRVANTGAGITNDAMALHAEILRSAGTINNGYGLYLGNIQATNKWSIYATDATAPSYLAGSLAVGTTSPGAKLSVQGNAAIGTYGTLAAPVNGMIVSGSVGVGTATPQALLDVAGTMRVTQICDENGSNCKTISGGWGGSGTVTNVGLSGNSMFSITGSPITGAGTMNIDWASQNQNLVLASPDGSSGTPSFRALAAADITSGTFALARLGTIPMSQISGTLAIANLGIIPAGNGGTGLDGSSAANGQLLIGNGSGYTLATIGISNGLSQTLGAGSISLTTNATNNNTASAIVARDPSGNFSAGAVDVASVGLRGNTTGVLTLNTPASFTNYTLTWPSSAGSPGQVLTTNGTSSLSWVTAPTNGGTFLAASGTAGTPGIAFNSDQDTGLWNPGANTIAISTNGNERLRINSSGHVGIGTTNPQFGLDVAFPTSGGGTAAKFGATRPIYLVPWAPAVGFNLYFDGTDLRYGTGSSSSYGAFMTVDDATGLFEYMNTSSSGNAGAVASPTTRFAITASGSVGIGTTSPGARLDVAGSARAQSMAIAGSGTITLNAPNSGSYSLRFPTSVGSAGQVLTTDGTNALSWVTAPTNGGTFLAASGTAGTPGIAFNSDQDTGFWNPGADILAASTGGSERLRIDGNGNIAIGTTNNFDKLVLMNSANAGSSFTVTTPGTQSGQQSTFALITKDNATTVGGTGTKGWQFVARGDAYTNAAQQNDFFVSYYNGSTWVDPIAIDSATANVGIGTTSPQFKLDIVDNVGDQGFRVYSSNSGQGLRIFPWVGSSSDVNIDPNEAGQRVHFGRDISASRWTFESGSVGIATDAPNALLDVNGASRSNSHTLAGAGTITLNAPTSGNYSLRFPTSVGSPGQVLTTDGTSALSWTTASSSVSFPLLSTTLGSVGTPVYSFSADSDTGLWSPGANTLAVSTGGTERLRVNSSGHLGLGTTNATHRLTVADSNSGSTMKIRNTAAAGYAELQFADSSDTERAYVGIGNPSAVDLDFRDKFYFDTNGFPLSFLTGGNPRMEITTGGNVGIGTTSPTTGARLDITGTGATASSIVIPRDTTANRPTTGVNGMMRYNTTTNKFEAYENGAWDNVMGASSKWVQTSNFTTTSTSHVDVTGASVLIPVVAGDFVVLKIRCGMRNSGGSNNTFVLIDHPATHTATIGYATTLESWDGGSYTGINDIPGSEYQNTGTTVAFVDGDYNIYISGAGNLAFRLRARASAGTATVQNCTMYFDKK